MAKKQVTGLYVRRLYSLTHTDRREWEQGCGSCGKGNDKKDGEKTQTGVINHVSDALTHSWGSEMKGNG